MSNGEASSVSSSTLILAMLLGPSTRQLIPQRSEAVFYTDHTKVPRNQPTLPLIEFH